MIVKLLRPGFPFLPILLFIAPFCFVNCHQTKTAPGQASGSGPVAALTDKGRNVDPGLDKIKLPPGFTIRVFAQVTGARSMCLSETGNLFVGTMEGTVYAVTDSDKNGVAEKVYTVASGLNSPNGVAFKDGNLYVAEINRILRFDNIETHLDNPPAYKVIYDRFPKDRSHGWKFIAFGPDGKLYVPVGAPCNICDEKDSIYASITRMNSDGSGFEIFSRGVRNTVGFDWDPATKQLWFTDNGRDNLGDDAPGDELNTAPVKGLHFGFPYCHQGTIPDPKFGKGKNCADYTSPALVLDPHVAALGMRFYTGTLFPAPYRNGIFIAEHGSWNRTTPIGYRVMFVRLENGRAVGYSPFATGWLDENRNVSGRPVDVETTPDGALLVSDDRSGLIYRISFQK
jgi:glucose/arabinose dehydrogenase